MIRLERIRQLLNDEEFIREVYNVVERAYEKFEDPAERINYVFYSFADDENKGAIAVFYLGLFPSLSVIEQK